MEIRLLGAVEVWGAGRRLDVGPPQRRVTLAALAVDADRPVLTETLIARIWGEVPPAQPRSAIHANVTLLRQVLQEANAAEGGHPPAGLVHRGGGYVLRVDPQRVDLLRLRGLVATASESSDKERAGLLQNALDLWRGPALADVPGTWPDRMREAWGLERLDVAVDWARTQLRLARYEQVIGRLRVLLAEYPLAEPLVAALMRALHATGRAAEALSCYTSIRRQLAEELGADPGPELRSLHQAILRGELERPAGPVASQERAVPAQLPVDLRGFTGRNNELAQLDRILAAAGQPLSTAVIVALAGTAGVGKTVLAVHWAHRVAEHFPDGQLYVNLRGFGPGGRVMEPTEALRGFLDALGVTPERIPPTLDAQAALYRSMLAGRRVLVILDNARDAEQVRPLLPGTSTALVLVTSRHQLTPLIATEGADPLTLDVLSTTEACELLGRRLGAERLAAEPEAVEAIIAACARLPLALAIAAARARLTNFSLAALAAGLGAVGRRLDTLNAGDPVSQVRAVFSWSYTALPPTAARLFRFLGLHPGPDISAPAAASLAALPLPETYRLLTDLARANLIAERAPGRYNFHDLMRAYAAELALDTDTDADRTAAVHRLLDHYLHTAQSAARLMHPYRELPTIALPGMGTTPEVLADRAEGLAWLTTERPVLLAVVHWAAATGFDTHIQRLGQTLAQFLNRRGHWHHWVAVQEAALAAARRQADRSGQADSHRSLANAYGKLSRYDEAQAHLRCALDLYTELGDCAGQATIHRGMGWVLERLGRFSAALSHVEQSLDLYREVGDRSGESSALNSMGWILALSGNHQRAIGYCEKSLDLHNELGNVFGQAAAWDSLGYANHHLGRYEQAVACYGHAINLTRQDGERYNLALSLVHLGDTHRAANAPDAAREAWQEALTILDELGHPDADRVRAKLKRRG